MLINYSYNYLCICGYPLLLRHWKADVTYKHFYEKTLQKKSANIFCIAFLSD